MSISAGSRKLRDFYDYERFIFSWCLKGMHLNETMQIGCQCEESVLSRPFCLNGILYKKTSILTCVLLCIPFRSFHSEVSQTSQKLLRTSWFCWAVLKSLHFISFQCCGKDCQWSGEQGKTPAQVWSWGWLERNPGSCYRNCLDSMATL